MHDITDRGFIGGQDRRHHSFPVAMVGIDNGTGLTTMASSPTPSRQICGLADCVRCAMAELAMKPMTLDEFLRWDDGTEDALRADRRLSGGDGAAACSRCAW